MFSSSQMKPKVVVILLLLLKYIIAIKSVFVNLAWICRDILGFETLFFCAVLFVALHIMNGL